MDKRIQAAQKMYDWALALHTEKRTLQSERLLHRSEAKLNETLTKVIREALLAKPQESAE